MRLPKTPFPYPILFWIRQSIPRRKATFKDVMESIQHQAVCVVLLTPATSLWNWSTSQPLFIEVIYKIFTLLYALGAIGLILASIYQTIHTLNEASFFFHRRSARTRGARRFFLIAWVVSLGFAIWFSWVTLLFTK